MKKYIPYVLITILLMVIASGVTYIVMDKKQDNNKTNENNNQNNNSENNDKVDGTNQDNDGNNDDNNEVVLKDGVEFVNIKKDDDKIIETFKVVLNGKGKELKVEYEYEYDENFKIHLITGLFNNYVFSGQEYFDIDKSKYTMENTFNINNIKSTFNENNFKLIKGTDNKNYLLVISNREVDDVLYIFNDKLELLNDDGKADYVPSYCESDFGDCNGFMITTFQNTPCEFENGINPWYKNSFNIKKYDITMAEMDFAVKIVDNKIYYLAAVIENDMSAILEERVYTINNNKLSYEVINSYKANGVCQQV